MEKLWAIRGRPPAPSHFKSATAPTIDLRIDSFQILLARSVAPTPKLKLTR